MPKSEKLIDRKSFEGKTIQRINTSAVNVTQFYFTDGTMVELEVEAVAPGLYGIVQCQGCSPAKKPA